MSSDSPRTFNNSSQNKKFSAALNSNNGRNSHTRQRLLSTKISAPLPINLPSLRSESNTEVPTSHNWGSSAAASPETAHVQHVELPVSRAWIIPSSTATPKSEPQRVSEATPNEEKTDEETKEMADTTRPSWDEMLDDGTDNFSVDVIEFEDGSKFPLNDFSPSDRFTEDYDRSYPVKVKPTPREEVVTPRRASNEQQQLSESSTKNAWNRNSEESRRRSSSDRKPFSLLQKGEPVSVAAERAQKRREEQEAIFEAARERAKQKASEMGAIAEKNKPKTTLADDEKAWVQCVEEIKTSKKLVTTNNFGASAWANYAENLQNLTANEASENPVKAPQPTERKPLVLAERIIETSNSTERKPPVEKSETHKTEKKSETPKTPPQYKEEPKPKDKNNGLASAWNNFASEEHRKNLLSDSAENNNLTDHSAENHDYEQNACKNNDTDSKNQELSLPKNKLKDGEISPKPYKQKWPYQVRTIRETSGYNSKNILTLYHQQSLKEERSTLTNRDNKNQDMDDLTYKDTAKQITIMTKKQTKENPSEQESKTLLKNDLKLSDQHEKPVFSILQHERSQKKPDTAAIDDSIEINYKDKIQDIFKTCQSPIFPQAIQKSIGDKPSHLSFMLDTKTALKKKNKTKNKIPAIVYKFPHSKISEHRGVYIMPTSLSIENLPNPPSSFPLPRQMMLQQQ